MPGEYSQYNLIGMATMFYLLRSTIDGMCGSGGYMIQRFMAAKNERRSRLLQRVLSGFHCCRSDGRSS